MLVGLAGGCGPSAPPRTAAPADRSDGRAAELATLIPRLMAEAEIPGLAIALVRADQIIWQRGFGVANAATGRPVTSSPRRSA